jgi:hypothetical protein
MCFDILELDVTSFSPEKTSCLFELLFYFFTKFQWKVEKQKKRKSVSGPLGLFGLKINALASACCLSHSFRFFHQVYCATERRGWGLNIFWRIGRISFFCFLVDWWRFKAMHISSFFSKKLKFNKSWNYKRVQRWLRMREVNKKS